MKPKWEDFKIEQKWRTEVKKHSQMLETEASENTRMKEKLDIDNQIEKLYLSEWYIKDL